MRSGSVGLTTMALMAPETGLLGGTSVLASKRVGPGPCSTQVGCGNAGVWPAMLRATNTARAAIIRVVAFSVKSGPFVWLRIALPSECASPRIPLRAMAPPRRCAEGSWTEPRPAPLGLEIGHGAAFPKIQRHPE